MDYDKADWEHEVKRDKALERIAELEARVAELSGHLSAICEMQQRHYGRGFDTHIELIDLAAAARAALERKQ